MESNNDVIDQGFNYREVVQKYPYVELPKIKMGFYGGRRWSAVRTSHLIYGHFLLEVFPWFNKQSEQLMCCSALVHVSLLDSVCATSSR